VRKWAQLQDKIERSQVASLSDTHARVIRPVKDTLFAIKPKFSLPVLVEHVELWQQFVELDVGYNGVPHRITLQFIETIDRIEARNFHPCISLKQWLLGGSTIYTDSQPPLQPTAHCSRPVMAAISFLMAVRVKLHASLTRLHELASGREGCTKAAQKQHKSP
jgi:hypothetical protein